MTWKVKMNEKKNGIDKNIRFLKKEIIKHAADLNKVSELSGKVRRLENESFTFDSNKVNPVRLENGAVVNLYTLTAFKKQLQHVDSYSIQLADHEVRIVYKAGKDQGRYLLVDMQKDFKGWELPFETI